MVSRLVIGTDLSRRCRVKFDLSVYILSNLAQSGCIHLWASVGYDITDERRINLKCNLNGMISSLTEGTLSDLLNRFTQKINLFSA